MAKKIVFIEDAYSDIFDIGEYYLGISELLKQKFEADLFKTIEPIALLPITYHLSPIQERLSMHPPIHISL